MKDGGLYGLGPRFRKRRFHGGVGALAGGHGKRWQWGMKVRFCENAVFAGTRVLLPAGKTGGVRVWPVVGSGRPRTA